jgi:uncharacterized protein YdiU (UPF0061 family)
MAMPVSPAYRAAPEFAKLGEGFFDPVTPAAFPAPRLRRWDARAAAEIGLETLTDEERLAHFARFEPLPDQPGPLAMRYHGHQFRHYNPDIGDGRGFLFAQARDRAGRLIDLGTKGSGQTPYSRFGDGRMTLQGGVREVIASAWLTARAVPGCAILALVETGETLQREDEPAPIRGAVLTRQQHSHVRIGTFQRHAAEERPDRIAALMEHAITCYYPQLADVPADARPAAFLEAAVAANAALAAAWMTAGYVHGVLNSDNMTVTGESFDYGPWRALPVFAPDFTAAYFDQTGLYAYARQAESTLWNLTRLAECLALIAPATGPLEAALKGFQAIYGDALAARVCARLGVAPEGREPDLALLRALFRFLAERLAPFEGAYFDLFGGPASAARFAQSPRARIYRGTAWDELRTLLFARTPDRPERLSSAYFEVADPAVVTIDVVRAAWGAIADVDDWTPLETILARIDESGAATA